MKTKNNSKHSNQVRIIGGEHRGRKIKFASAEGLRPTADSVRERLFNWLGQDLAGKSVLDLFAGSGALGLEAASRHAAKVVLVESNRRTAAALQQQVREFGLPEKVSVHTGEALDYLAAAQEGFDVVFLDPPFVWQEWVRLFELLQPRLQAGTRVYVEAGEFPPLPEYLAVLKEGRSGLSRYALLVCGLG
ncbi:16S rRNA (guanine(966)-N(2))-methyltransferase RsmD [Eikenella sp. S3360]|uniref:16S rRNA (Guanine(966)-N(2))-methyltransferase RsmD n=1 Tax=Eikenella glucosivorans TaxID=2766967 RepID=A0ABS0NCC8_9NEIS|nr:16S rRNA (guanine(966)-N(2))-methyltransferase RsmD [Eikenella glucosivorans]MBH5329968.1 16S rRNA (guanine(966)-N(2))-methyltransferase RsmD [Eikenella glucosivorans]